LGQENLFSRAQGSFKQRQAIDFSVHWQVQGNAPGISEALACGYTLANTFRGIAALPGIQGASFLPCLIA
jgi:hypothetical protein